jgi:pimeloyl-ACP methyl ester carboxylesterase
VTSFAIQHPCKVRSLMPVSGTLQRDGQYSEVVAGFPDMVTNAAEIGGGIASSPLADMYSDVDWTTAFRKMGELESEAWDWMEEARAIKTPTLLIFADADSMTGQHLVAMYQAFGGFARDASYDGSVRPAAQLAILPGRTHYDVMETVTVAGSVESFFPRTDA